CQECKAGVMRLRYITYFTWLDGELITVPNFPAWICDMCGRREYDARAISWLNTLLNPATGRRPSSRRRTGMPRVDRPQP
ncbi:MAG: YgiT-type zinc finger protein, partial [Chloroflexota bacterium]